MAASQTQRMMRRLSRVLREIYEEENDTGLELFISTDFNMDTFVIELRVPHSDALGIRLEGYIVHGSD